MLLVMLLSVSVLAAGDSLDGFSDSLGTILNMFTVESQDVTVPIFGGLTELSVSLSEQISAAYLIYNIIADPYIGVEMDTNIGEPRGESLLYAGVD